MTTPQDPSNEPTPGPKVPEKYDFKPVEGKEYPAAFTEGASTVFKELGLDQAQADKLVEFWNKNSESQSDLAVKAVNEMRKGWVGEVESMLGAKGDALMEKLAPIAKMKDAVFTGEKGLEQRQAFEHAMNLTGAGDNPNIIGALLKMADRFTEGTHVSGKGPSPEGQTPTGKTQRPSAAQSMWPNLPSSAA